MRKRNDDIRLECVNWDEEQPAKIKCRGMSKRLVAGGGCRGKRRPL